MEPEEQRERPSPFSVRAIVTALVVVTVATMAVLLAAYHSCGFEGCPPVEQVSGFVPDEASVVLDRDGEEVSKLFRVNRVVVGMDSLPEHVKQAFVAIEDQEFYDHSGVDLSRVLGAAWRNIQAGGIAEGFSTISMQVARNVFPEQIPGQERTLNRKLSEIKVARELERRYSKQEILGLYLNQIYFGSGAWGIEAASREYFGKSSTELDLGEAALLAALPQAPSRLNPRENMEGAMQRRTTVLRRMQEQGYIDAARMEEVQAQEPELGRSRMETADRAAYFVEHVRRVLEERMGDRIYTGGYQIHTTLDLEAQAVAERELREQLQAIESGAYGTYPRRSFASVVSDSSRVAGQTAPYLQGAVVVMGVRSGDVLALVGGRDFEDSKYNRATQARRQPGSAFKPVVYAAAIQAGYPPNMVLEDTPYRLAQDGQVWEPRNYDGSFAGEITMRQALVNSKNIPTIRLAEQVGLTRVIGMARSLGLSGDIPHFLSIAIGAAEVTLIEMVAAYATLASLGDRPDPRFISHVTDRDGNIVFQEPPRTEHVLATDVAFVTLDLMRDVVDRGTGTAVRAAGFGAPAAGKTGTTNESADVWFLGATPTIATGVWIGMDEPERIMARATGGRLAAPVWGRIMSGVNRGSGAWSPPPGVERYAVDEMGNVVGSGCPTYGPVREEYFIRGTVMPSDCGAAPYGYDSLYADTGLVGEDDDTWWRRLRERIFGDEEGDSLQARPRPDTIIQGEPPPRPRDTIRLTPDPPDTMPRRRPRDTIRMDSTPELAGVPVDTVPPDTLPR